LLLDGPIIIQCCVHIWPVGCIVINSLSETLENVLKTMMRGWPTVHFILVTTNVQWR